MRAKWLAILPILAVAGALIAGLLEYGLVSTTSYADGVVTRSRPDEPVVPLDGKIFDSVCPPGHHACAYSEQSGFFARPNVPRIVAILFGLLVPPLLLVVGLAYAIGSRWGWILAGILAAGLCAFVMIDFRNVLVVHKGDAAYRFDNDAPFQPPLWTTETWGDCGRACKGPRMDWVSGYYLRDDIPRELSLSLGCVLPGMLLLGTAAFAVGASRRTRYESAKR